jgi:hypothetical protein
MKLRIPLICGFLLVSATAPLPSYSGLQDLFNGAMKALGVNQGLTEEDIVKGLKQALEIGTNNAIALVSRNNGYFKNPEIKIPLPDNVQKAEKFIRGIGFSRQVDDFELSMNRAAERAAPKAKAIFWDAIKNMSFSDARSILSGPEDAATSYFRQKTSPLLHSDFKPIVNQAMSEVGVTRTYQSVEQKMRPLPFIGSMSVDLDEYVTDKALDGLFLMLAEEEKKIRQDPAARVTVLLKKVFGSQPSR